MCLSVVLLMRSSLGYERFFVRLDGPCVLSFDR